MVEDTRPGYGFILALRYFENLGVPSLAARSAFNSLNRRIRDPLVRWCGREGPRGLFLSRLGGEKESYVEPSRYRNQGIRPSQRF